MKKEELTASVHEIRSGLKSDLIVQSYSQAWDGQLSNHQISFATNVLAYLVEGIGNYQRFTPAAREISKLLKITAYYEEKSNSEILHHIAQAKGRLQPPGQPAQVYRDSYMSQTQTIFFIEAHRRVLTISDLLNNTLHAKRPEGELLLEGISDDGGPSLDHLQEVLATIAELVNTYCESQGDSEKPRIEISYLDFGSNYQIGVKVDAKAEVGINLSRLLTELFRYVTNPRAYMRERRADGIMKEITMIADLQKKVDAGELTPEAAHQFTERLLSCGQKLAVQRVLPSGLFRERTDSSPATELLRLINETAKPPALPAPQFAPISKITSPAGES